MGGALTQSHIAIEPVMQNNTGVLISHVSISLPQSLLPRAYFFCTSQRRRPEMKELAELKLPKE